MTQRADAIVIGAGLGGLSAAATLARAGRKVLVLEHHSVPGGYAHEFRRGKFRFDVSLHAIDGVAPGGWAYAPMQRLGILDRVSFHRLDPFYAIRMAGEEIVVHADVARYKEDLIRRFSASASGICSLFDEIGSVYREVQQLQFNREMDGRMSMSEALTRHPHAMRAMGESWGEFMGRHITDQKLQSILSGLWYGYLGLPPTRLNAAAVAIPWVSYHHCGAFYPRGGSMAISRALEAIIKDHGGRVHYRQRVMQIHVEARRAVGVTTDRGLTVRGEAIISNASAPDTLLRLLPEGVVSAPHRRRMDSAPPSLSIFTVYLGLDQDLRAQGRLPYHLFHADGSDLEQLHAATLAGDWARVPMSLVHYNNVDPDCAPPGCSIVAISCLAPWDYADVWGTGGSLEGYRENPRYLELKRRAAAILLSRVEPYLPGLRRMIVHMEVSTPLTNLRYSLNPRGAIYGYEQSREGRSVGRRRAQTPIPNLFLAGAWTTPGGGQSAALISGESAARQGLSWLDARTSHEAKEVA